MILMSSILIWDNASNMALKMFIMYMVSLVPITSMSHWANCLYLPFCGLSALHTLLFAYIALCYLICFCYYCKNASVGLSDQTLVPGPESDCLSPLCLHKISFFGFHLPGIFLIAKAIQPLVFQYMKNHFFIC